MTLFQRYTFQGLCFFTCITSLILTAVLWIAQSLKFGKFFAYGGFSLKNFLMMMVNVIPSILVVALPGAFLGALVWRYHRLVQDNEYTVMGSFGAGKNFFCYPALCLALWMTLILACLTFFLAPMMEKKQESLQQQVFYALAVHLIAPGIFLNLGNHTLYVDKQLSPTTFQGVLLARQGPSGHYALVGKRATIVSQNSGVSITFYDGLYHSIPVNSKPRDASPQVAGPGGKKETPALGLDKSQPLMVTFEKYTLNIMPKVPKLPAFSLQSLTLPQLWQKFSQNQGPSLVLARELHKRCLLPLLPWFYAWWVPRTLLAGGFWRKNLEATLTRVFLGVGAITLGCIMALVWCWWPSLMALYLLAAWALGNFLRLATRGQCRA